MDGYIDLISPHAGPVSYPLKRLSTGSNDAFAEMLGAPVSLFIDRKTGLRQAKFDPIPGLRF